MISNFDFLKNIDKELFEIIEDAAKLLRDEYFSQAVVQVRVFGEKMAKRILNEPKDATFDDILNCLKDKVKSEREKEFVEDLFFIKKQGNACAHGEKIEASRTLEIFERAFEASINYAYSKTKDEKLNELFFDKTLLITNKPQKELTLIDKYLEASKNEELLNSKQGDFNSKVEKKGLIKNAKKYKPNNEKKAKIKQKIKEAKKNLKENIDFSSQKQSKKNKNVKKCKAKKNVSKFPLIPLAFAVFTVLALFFLTKMIFVFKF